MNYLAHLYLSDGTPHSLLGNLLGDFVKGNNLIRFPEAVQRGIRLHRQVDSFTDSHPVVQRAITRISPRWGWFSGIILDVWFDHILAANWDRHSRVSLRAFTDEVNQILMSQTHLMPDDARERLTCVVRNDRLFSYARLDGIFAALKSISERIRERMPRKPVYLEDAIPDLCALQDDLAADFDDFFPELVAFANGWRPDAAPVVAVNPSLAVPVVPAG